MTDYFDQLKEIMRTKTGPELLTALAVLSQSQHPEIATVPGLPPELTGVSRTGNKLEHFSWAPQLPEGRFFSVMAEDSFRKFGFKTNFRGHGLWAVPDPNHLGDSWCQKLFDLDDFAFTGITEQESRRAYFKRFLCAQIGEPVNLIHESHILKLLQMRGSSYRGESCEVWAKIPQPKFSESKTFRPLSPDCPEWLANYYRRVGVA